MYLFLATTFLKTIPYSLKDPTGNLTLLLMAKDQHACERMAHEEGRQLTERDILASLTSRIVYLTGQSRIHFDCITLDDIIKTRALHRFNTDSDNAPPALLTE